MQGFTFGLVFAMCSFVLADRPTSCPYSYDQIGRKCYIVLDLYLNFFEAMTACDAVDGKIVQLEHQGHALTVARYLQRHKQIANLNSVWLGATNLQGKWLYLDSDLSGVLDYWSLWTPGKQYRQSNNCAVMSKIWGWTWQIVSCNDRHKVLCSRTLRDNSSTTPSWNSFSGRK